MKIWLLLLSLPFVSACFLLEFLTPQSTPPELEYTGYAVVRPVDDFPGFVEGMVYIDGVVTLVSEEVCILLSAEQVWQEGDFWDADSDAPEIEILIDNVRVAPDTIYAVGPAIVRSDGENGSVGQYPLQFRYCSIFNVLSGEYPLMVTFRTSSNAIFQYTWIVRIP